MKANETRLETLKAANDFSEHTIGEDYFFGYMASKSLVKRLEEVIIRPFESDRDEYIYYSNHHIRGYVEGTTKVVEVPGAQLAEQLVKIHRVLKANDRIGDIEITCEVDTEDFYEAAEEIFRPSVEQFYREFQPEGDVVITRPEEFLECILSEVMGVEEDIIAEAVKSSNYYIDRLEEPDLTWEDTYEAASGIHPKFSMVEEAMDILQNRYGIDISTNSTLGSSVRGYKFDLEGRTLTSLSRAWGRAMYYHLISPLVDEYDVDRILFNDGVGGLQEEYELNDIIVPTSTTSDTTEPLEIENSFSNEDYSEQPMISEAELYYDVDSLADETTDYVDWLQSQGVTCVGTGGTGIVKAVEDADVPVGILLYLMDVPIKGEDISQTNYDSDFKNEVVRGNRRLNLWTLDHLGLLDAASVA